MDKRRGPQGGRENAGNVDKNNEVSSLLNPMAGLEERALKKDADE